MSNDHADTAGGSAGPEPDTGVTLYRPIIVAILYLANLFTGFSVLIGLILAYVWRNDRDVTEWEETHFTYLIRTFWIGFWVCLLGPPLPTRRRSTPPRTSRPPELSPRSSAASASAS